MIHITVIKENLAPAAQAAGSGDQNALAVLNEAMLQHWADHIAAAEAQGVDKSIVNQLKNELRGVAKQVGEMQAQAQAAMQEQQALTAGVPGESALPGELPAAGAPSSAAPPGMIA